MEIFAGQDVPNDENVCIQELDNFKTLELKHFQGALNEVGYKLDTLTLSYLTFGGKLRRGFYKKAIFELLVLS